MFAGAARNREPNCLICVSKSALKIDLGSSQFPYLRDTPPNLCFTHKTRKFVNAREMESYLKQHPQKKIIEMQRDEKNVKSQTIQLAVGMPVICHTTSKKKS